jgi:hypothetical protein
MGSSPSRQHLERQRRLCIEQKTEDYIHAPRGQVDLFTLNDEVKICHRRYKEALAVLEVHEKNSSSHSTP